MEYAGPIKYWTKTKVEAKAYIILYAFASTYRLTWGLYLELLPNLHTKDFLINLKRLIVRRGRPVQSTRIREILRASRTMAEERHERQAVSLLDG